MAATKEERPFELDADAKEFYVDSAHIVTQLYSTIAYLGKLRENEKPLVHLIVRMSPPMMKVLSLILSKHAKDYERNFGPISLPKQLLHGLGLEELL